MQLIQTLVQNDLRRAAQDLSEGVETGHITGLGVVVMLRGRRFFVDCFGAMVRDPHAARGYVAALDDCLRDIAHRRKDTNTTV